MAYTTIIISLSYHFPSPQSQPMTHLHNKKPHWRAKTISHMSPFLHFFLLLQNIQNINFIEQVFVILDYTQYLGNLSQRQHINVT